MQKHMLTLDQALAILDRMEAAAPASTAEKLSDIAHLLQSLSHDNEYLVGLYGEALILPVAAQSEESPPERALPVVSANDHRRSEIMLAEMDMLYVQMDERLRAPIQVIQECNDRLADALIGNVAPEEEDLLQQVSLHASAAVRLLDGMKQILAIKCGLFDVTPLVFSVTLMMREAVRQVQDRLNLRDQQLEVAYPDDELKALGDYQQILVILIDLLDNAIRYTPNGGTIQLSAEDLGTDVLFSVQDTGIGISAEDAERVGQPYWRALYEPLVAQHAGTGLRVYLAREILKLQGGELIFSGEPGLGSTFSFTLPVHTY